MRPPIHDEVVTPLVITEYGLFDETCGLEEQPQHLGKVVDMANGSGPAMIIVVADDELIFKTTVSQLLTASWSCRARPTEATASRPSDAVVVPSLPNART